MAESALDKLLKIYKRPLVRISLYVITALLLLWGYISSCTGPVDTKLDYYRIARDTTWYPFDLSNKEQNMVGFTNDLLSDISSSQNIKMEIFDVSSKSLFFGLDRGNWDGVLSSKDPDVINKQKYEFSLPFYVNGFILLVKNDSTIKSLNDIDGKIVGIPKELELNNAIVQKNAIFSPYASMSKAIEDLIVNRIDVVVINFIPAQRYLRGVYAGKIKAITTPLAEQALRLVTKKTPTGLKLIAEFNKGIEKLVKEGTYEKMLAKWSLATQI